MNNSRRTYLWGCSSSLSLFEYIIFCAYYYSVSFFGRSGVLIFLRFLRAEHLLSGKKCLGFAVGWLVGCLGHISRVINSPFYISPYLSLSLLRGLGWDEDWGWINHRNGDAVFDILEDILVLLSSSY